MPATDGGKCTSGTSWANGLRWFSPGVNAGLCASLVSAGTLALFAHSASFCVNQWMKYRAAACLLASLLPFFGRTNWWLLPQTPPWLPIFGNGAVTIFAVCLRASSTCQMPCQLKAFLLFLREM